jgi:hypothetical protein
MRTVYLLFGILLFSLTKVSLLKNIKTVSNFIVQAEKGILPKNVLPAYSSSSSIAQTESKKDTSNNIICEDESKLFCGENVVSSGILQKILYAYFRNSH